jgi:hypothetical protein
MSAAVCRKWCGRIQCSSKAAHNPKNIDYDMPLQFRGTYFLFLSHLHEFLLHILFCWFSICDDFMFLYSSYNIAWFNNTLFAVYIQRGPAFIDELMQVIPNSHYIKRGTYELKKVWHFTDIVFNLIGSTRHLYKFIQIHLFSDCGICKE